MAIFHQIVQAIGAPFSGDLWVSRSSGFLRVLPGISYCFLAQLRCFVDCDNHAVDVTE